MNFFNGKFDKENEENYKRKIQNNWNMEKEPL